MVDFPEPDSPTIGDGLPARDARTTRRRRPGCRRRAPRADDVADGERLRRPRTSHQGARRGDRALRRAPDLTNGVEARCGREQPSGVLVFGLGEDVGGRAGLDDLAAVHHGDVSARSAARPRSWVMSRTTGAELRGERVEVVEDAALHGDVERRRGLVGDQQLRAAGQADGDERALAHPAGELVRVLAARAWPGRGCRRGRAARAASGGRRPGRQAVDLQGLGDLVADAHQTGRGSTSGPGDQADPARRGRAASPAR